MTPVNLPFVERCLHVANLGLEILQLLLDCSVFLGHLLVLGLPLVAVLLECLDFAFEVAGLDIGLAESGDVSHDAHIKRRTTKAAALIDHQLTCRLSHEGSYQPPQLHPPRAAVFVAELRSVCRDPQDLQSASLAP